MRRTYPCSSLNAAALSEAADIPISETVDDVIVDHTDCLHVRVDHRRPNEAEPTALQIAAECVRLGGGGGNLSHRAPPVLPRPAADELPAIGVEAAELFLHDQKRLCALHCRGDLHPVADDPGIRGQFRNAGR